MHSDASGSNARSASQLHVAQIPDGLLAVDISQVAQAVLFYGNVAMDAEAFRVTVTRLSGADGSNLTSEERTRLLDVLCHAQSIQSQWRQSSKTFPVWIVASELRRVPARPLAVSRPCRAGSIHHSSERRVVPL
jgi:hypothetical protein